MRGCVCLQECPSHQCWGQEARVGGSWADSTDGTQRLGQFFLASECEGLQDVHSQCATLPCMGTLHSCTQVSRWPDPSSAIASLVRAAPGTAAHPLCPSHEQDREQLCYPMQSENLSVLKIAQVNITPAVVLHFPSKWQQGCLPHCLLLPRQDQAGQGGGYRSS